MAAQLAAAMLGCNPPNVSAMPAATSAERMRRLRERRARGEASPSCKACGGLYNRHQATPARLQAGLCACCWHAMPEGKQERRAADRHRYAANAERRRQGLERVRRYRQRRQPGGQVPS